MSDTEHETQILMKASFGKMSCLLVKKESSLETLLIFWQRNSCKRFDGKTWKKKQPFSSVEMNRVEQSQARHVHHLINMLGLLI